MPGGRPRKRRFFNFQRRKLYNEEKQVGFDCIPNTLITLNEEHCALNEASTSNSEEIISSLVDRPARASKIKCCQQLREIEKIFRKVRSETISWQAFKRRAKESSVERSLRQENLRRRAARRRALESTQDRSKRLEDMRQRAFMQYKITRGKKRPEISESESSSLTTVTPSRMVIALDLATLKTSALGTSVKMDPDSSLTDQDLHLAMTCEVFPTDEPDSLFKIKEEPIDPGTCKQDILSDSVMQELRHFSKKPSSGSNHGGSLFQTPVFIKEEPISSEDET